MSRRSNHVEERKDGVKRVSHNDNAFFHRELNCANPLGIVRLYDPNRIVNFAFSLQAHVFELPI